VTIEGQSKINGGRELLHIQRQFLPLGITSMWVQALSQRTMP
jgi:hypothetical protein